LKLILKNFQSISDAEFELGPLTVLVGQSDLGKSAVIRALYLLHRNQGGLELVKHGKSKLEVTQLLDNGTRVSILKGKGINTYFSGDKTYVKVGRDVPEGVSSELKTQDLVLDKDQVLDLNFCRQFDSPFLLSDSTTVITKAISSLSGINIVYAAIREGTSEHQKIKAKSEVLQDTILGLLKYDALSEEADRLTSVLSKVRELSYSVDLAKAHASKCSLLLEIMEDLGIKEIDTEPLTRKINECAQHASSLGALRNEKTSRELLLKTLSGISDYVLASDVDSDSHSEQKCYGIALLRSSSLDDARQKNKEEEALLLKIYEVEDTISSVESAIKSHEESIVDLEKQVKVCPTCQRPL